MKTKKRTNLVRNGTRLIASITIYKAADATLTGAKKATDAYSAAQDASENVGDKVGAVIGTAYQATSDAVGNIKRWFK